MIDSYFFINIILLQYSKKRLKRKNGLSLEFSLTFEVNRSKHVFVFTFQILTLKLFFDLKKVYFNNISNIYFYIDQNI